MRIIVTHLTRMKGNRICVAGLDWKTGHHVRPVTPPSHQLTRQCLKGRGGLFHLGAVVELGRVQYVGKPPEVEDFCFNPKKVRYVGALSEAEFREVLRAVAKGNLRDIFGDSLLKSKWSRVVMPGTGHASLGILSPRTRPVLFLRDGKIRMHLHDGVSYCDLSVTDIRLVRDDHTTPNTSLLASWIDRIDSGADVILAVGLTRAFARHGDRWRWHWLQINNIFIMD